MELELLSRIVQGQTAMALATIIEVKGSSPRHTGSNLLIGDGSGPAGSVGGGRGEAEAVRACQRCLQDRAPVLLTTDMTATDIQGPNMVCGGANTMLIEPLLERAPYQAALRLVASGERAMLVKRFATADPGGLAIQVAVLGPDGAPVFGQLDPALAPAAARALGAGQPRFDPELGVFFDPIAPEEQLLILGGGHVGQALANLAPALGFKVTVVDDRPEFLAPGRFPAGVATLQAGFQEAIAGFPCAPATYAVVVTRGHLLDLECARALLLRPFRYAGLMGSARKIRFLVDQVRQDGLDPARIDNLWAPIGLDIGAETPAELAIAILGELVAVRRGSRTLPDLISARSARRG
jgi:xanthine dehydrogenase accessory factor